LSTETFTPRLSKWQLLALAAGLLAAGCRQNMHDQHKIKPLGESTFFADGQGARPLPAHTVARGDLREGPVFTGLGPDNKPTAQMPPEIKVDRELLLRGQERFNIYCSPCHGRLGLGNGMIVQRGYKQPTSYHIERLRAAPIGYFFNVMTEGYGVMPTYAPQIPVHDRWAIAAYIRVLQYSQNANPADLASLPPADQKKVQDDLNPRPQPKSSEAP
jgi:mono/diheme cytochrome c family protein